jgi:hypothetical protein
MLPTKFRFIWPGGFRGEDFKKSAYQKQELPVAAMDRFMLEECYTVSRVLGAGYSLYEVRKETS